jgi:hypothetical protein
MLQEQRQTISVRNSVREWTHVLLVNKPCSRLHSFCATGMSSGLAVRMFLTRVLREVVARVYCTTMDLLMISFSYRSTQLFWVADSSSVYTDTKGCRHRRCIINSKPFSMVLASRSSIIKLELLFRWLFLIISVDSYHWSVLTKKNVINNEDCCFVGRCIT